MAKNQKKLKPELRAYLKLYEQYDAPLITAIRDGARREERTVVQQIKYLLRRGIENADTASGL